MQQTNFEGTINTEEFYAEAASDWETKQKLVAQMNDRMMDLEPKGHTLVKRTFSQKRTAERAKKAKRKLQRLARRQSR